ncbi:hypothetical protein ACQ4LE_002826 [Meloidogyne hapla]
MREAVDNSETSRVPRSGLIVQIPEEPSELVSVKVFIKTSVCPKRVELCSGCSTKIKKFLCEEPPGIDQNDEHNASSHNSFENHSSGHITNSSQEGLNVLNETDFYNNIEQNSKEDSVFNEVVNETQEFVNCNELLCSDEQMDSSNNNVVEQNNVSCLSEVVGQQPKISATQNKANNAACLEEIDLTNLPHISTDVPPPPISIQHQKNTNNETNINCEQYTPKDSDQIVETLDVNINESVTNNLMKDISANGVVENLNSAISAIEEQQTKVMNAADEEAIRKCGMGNCEVVIKNSDFDRLVKMIERRQRRKHLVDDISAEDDIDAELDKQIRSAANLLRGTKRKSRQRSISSHKVYDTECEDDEVNDENENRCVSSANSSVSVAADGPILRKRNLKSLLEKQSKNSSENGSSESSEWLSKNNAEKSEASTESPIESDSDTDDTFVEAPKLTPAQRQAGTEMRRLLRDTRIKILDSDDSDATMIKTGDEDDSGSDSDKKNNQRVKSKGLNPKDLNSDENGISNKPSSSKIFSPDSEPKKRMTAKKSHMDKNRKEKNLGGPKRKKRRIICSDDDEDEQSLDADENNKISDDEDLPKRVGRRKVIPKEKLAQATKDAEKAEKERRKRLEERQREFNGIEVTTDEAGNTSLICTDEQAIPKLRNIILDQDRENEPPLPVRVHPSLVKVLKKHQAEGIQFLYNCTIESLSRLDGPGGGAILGHCMGLGKTLQIIAFLHTILTHEKISKKINKVLVVVPKNVVLNWMNEFEKWLCGEADSINYTELDSWKTHEERLKAIKHWYKFDGPSVLIIGYDLFRLLTLTEEDKIFLSKKKTKNGKPEKKKKLTMNEKRLERLKPQFCQYLQESPHMVICDEGHKLKSPSTVLYLTMNKIKTPRRICMTGTPLQNDLEEYFCMVNFVKPNLLGSLEEFKNRFSNIIKRGRSKDASAHDVRCMRRRCHVLFERLKGVLDRRDYGILRDTLPAKQEYVVNIRLTKVQIDLYKQFLELRNNPRNDNRQGDLGMRLLYDHIILYRVWTHPYLLLEQKRREERKKILRDVDDFVVSDEETSLTGNSDSDDIEVLDNDGKTGPSNSQRNVSRHKLKRLKNDRHSSIEPEIDLPSVKDWTKDLISEEDRDNFALSNKLMLLVAIIKKCEQIGDKLLVFSQFLDSISLIERMLMHFDRGTGWFVDEHQALMMAHDEKWGWYKDFDYSVIDGSVGSVVRDRIQTNFNDTLNPRNRLLLISTRAGSLGTNLIGANRVIIFDCCWNPSHDTQSLFRVYRFGQVKPVYIYRFVAQGTMEERIYNRQVTKESIAKRVTQSAQIQRHYTSQELDEMYRFEPDILSLNDSEQRPRLDPPKDRLLGDIILEKTDAIVSYHPHDMLFDELEDERLNDEEREEAWKDYETEREGRAARQQPVINGGLSPQQIQILDNLQQQFPGNQFGRDLRILFNYFPHDSVFNKCLTVQGITRDMALHIFRIKAFLGYFIYQIPQNLAGEINNADKFNKYFIGILDHALQNNEGSQFVYQKALLALKTTVSLVSSVPQCSIGLEYAKCLFPDLNLNGEANSNNGQ